MSCIYRTVMPLYFEKLNNCFLVFEYQIAGLTTELDVEIIASSEGRPYLINS